MAVDRSLIGTSMEPVTVEIEKGAIRKFAEAIGETNPLFLDEAYAKARGYASIVAPPTYATTFRPVGRQPWVANLDMGRILAGEQGFVTRRQLVAGDVVTYAMHLVGVEEKEGRSGKLEIIDQEMRVCDLAGELLVTNRRVTVYRVPKSG